MTVAEKNEPYITVKDDQVKVDDIVPDLSCCNVISRASLSNMEEIGKVSRLVSSLKDKINK